MIENETSTGKVKRPYHSAGSGRHPDLMSRFGIGFGIVQPPGKTLVSANAAFLGILGFASLKHAKSWDPAALAADSQDFAGIWEELRATGRYRANEMRIRRADGREAWISFSANVLDGRPDRIELLMEDITERKLKAERLAAEAILAMKSETLDSIGTLAGGLAHDINNLLTPIVGYSDLLLQKVGPDSGIRCELSEIQTAAGRVVEIVQNLLAFGRRQVVDRKRVDLNSEIRSLIPGMRKELGAAVDLRVAVAESTSPILGDARQIHHVLACLVTNAKEAMPEGGRLEIETETLVQEAEGGGLLPGAYSVLTVKDTGIGMSAEIQARVFEPFFSTKRLYKGAGLGLSVVYGIVKQCRGHIRLESAPGQGTVFRIFFPAEPVLNVQAPAAFITTA